MLALFSEVLGAPQPDWPPHTRQCGFAFYDRLDKGTGTSSELTQFLDSGPAPIVFTLGSSAVMVAGDFYVESAAAAAELGRRAVLLVGRDRRNLPERTLPAGVIMAAPSVTNPMCETELYATSFLKSVCAMAQSAP